MRALKRRRRQGSHRVRRRANVTNATARMPLFFVTSTFFPFGLRPSSPATLVTDAFGGVAGTESALLNCVVLGGNTDTRLSLWVLASMGTSPSNSTAAP